MNGSHLKPKPKRLEKIMETHLVITDSRGNWFLCDRHGASCDLKTKAETRAMQGARFLCGDNVRVVRNNTVESFLWAPVPDYSNQ